MRPSSKKQILLIDDNTEFAELVKEYIEDIGKYEIVHFKSGKPALAYLEVNCASIIGILSDIMMKEIDGIEFLALIRKSDRFGHIPLIFISGTEPMVFKNLLNPEHYSGFIQKPIQMNLLTEMLEVKFAPKNLEKKSA